MFQREKEKGQGLVEYALLLIFIAMIVLLILMVLGVSLSDYYQYIIDELPF